MSNINYDSIHQEVHSTVLSLVDAGVDMRLQDWLRLNKLLIKSSHCKDCSIKMVYTNDTKMMDKYRWRCHNKLCTGNVMLGLSVRHASFFETLPKALTLFDIFKVILLWCEGRQLSSIDFDSERQRKLSRQIFNQCDKVAENQMKEWEGKFKIGGRIEQSLILMDTFPHGYMTSAAAASEGKLSHSTQGNNQFLCFADVSYMPPMVWVHLLRQGNKIPQLARETIHTGSIIITNTRIISSDRLRQETNFRAVDVEALCTLDVPNKSNVCENLEVIWHQVLPVLKQAQHVPMPAARLMLSRFLWCQRFGSTAPSALYNLLLHVAQQFPLPR